MDSEEKINRGIKINKWYAIPAIILSAAVANYRNDGGIVFNALFIAIMMTVVLFALKRRYYALLVLTGLGMISVANPESGGWIFMILVLMVPAFLVYFTVRFIRWWVNSLL